MIAVDTVNLKNDIDKLNRLISEYEEIQLNLFNELKDSCINWQDGNSLLFDEKIYLEKVEANAILESLSDRKSILVFVYDRYSSLGKKIKCNLDNKSKLINYIQECINDANSITNSLSSIDYNSGLENKMVLVKRKLMEIKKVINQFFDKVEMFEKDINNQINKLEKVIINEFNYKVN